MSQGHMASCCHATPQRRWTLVLLFVVLTLSGCAQLGGVAADADATPVLPTLALDADGQFSNAAGAPQPTEADLHWWRRFDDAGLAAWVERALANNPGIAIADEQVVQARALLQSARARRGVQIGVEADTTLRLRRDAGQRRLQPGAALVLDYDTDLWGGLRQAQDSAAAGLMRSQDLVQATRLATAGLAARAYLEWRVAAHDARLLADQLQLQRDSLAVVGVRVRAGLAPALDQQRAAAELAATEADQQAAQVREHQALAALQVLAGDAPRPPPLLGTQSRPATPGAATGADIAALRGVLPVARPLDLLRLRPDLRAAEQALVGAAADVGVAEAALRPRLRLPGQLVWGAALGGGMLELVSATLAAALDVTLFDGGAGRADVDAARSRVRAAAQVYRQSLLQALQQVEAALVAYRGASLQVAARLRASASADAALEHAQALYRAGLVGSLELIDAQRTALANQRGLLQARADVAAATILSYEAMGLIDATPADRAEIRPG